jgi:hypothetical protein
MPVFYTKKLFCAGIASHLGGDSGMTGPVCSGIAIKPGVLLMHGPNRPNLTLY